MSLVYQVPPSVSESSSNNKRRRNGIYIGDKSDAKNYDKLTKHWNVTHILNVTTAKQSNHIGGVSNYFEKMNNSPFTYMRIPIYDSEMSSQDLYNVYADQIVSFISSGLYHGSVLVHCHRGISRSSTAVLFYMMRRLGMTLIDSMTTIKRRRPQIEPIPSFMKILHDYEQKCIDLGHITLTTTTIGAPEASSTVATSSRATTATAPEQRKVVIKSTTTTTTPALPNSPTTITTSHTNNNDDHHNDDDHDDDEDNYRHHHRSLHATAAVIGPALPPSALPGYTEGDKRRVENDVDSNCINDKLPIASSIIGPTLPPKDKRREDNNIDSNSNNNKNNNNKRSHVIGPSLPPRPSVPQEDKREETKRLRVSPIGPTLPPTPSAAPS